MKTLHLTDDELQLLSNLMSVGVSNLASQISTLQNKIRLAAESKKDKPKSRGLHTA